MKTLVERWYLSEDRSAARLLALGGLAAIGAVLALGAVVAALERAPVDPLLAALLASSITGLAAAAQPSKKKEGGE